MAKGKWIGILFTSVLVLFLQAANALGIDITDKLTIEGVLAGAYQYQDLSDEPDLSDKGRGALPFQPEISFRPTEKDELFALLGFAAGNGLSHVSPFILRPWAAPLEDDVKNINGSSRDYLLTAWYKHNFELGESHSLGLTGGLIDATDYLDNNAYSNDEFTQFMNEALVNGPNAFLPSYDIGGAFEWGMGDLTLDGVVMHINENDDGNPYNFYGVELSYRLETSLGKGNYRVLVDWSSADFLDPEGDNEERQSAILLSCDQTIGEILGLWIRFGWQDDKAAVNFVSIYSGGIDIKGKLWGREEDNVGIGYAFLGGGNQDVDETHVAEVYVRFVLHRYFALTLDVQYMRDGLKSGEGPKGFIYGIRMAAHF
ncbi:MAG: carbohydrate porin [Desulfobacteraceae bacterium]|jgi:porin